MFCKIVLPSSEIHKLPSVPKTFDELNQLCQKKYAGKLPPNPTFKYKDSDEELITLLNDEDLETAILTHEQEKIKTLRLFIVEGESPLKASSDFEKKSSLPLSAPVDKPKGNTVYFEEKVVKNTNFKRAVTTAEEEDDLELDRLAGELHSLGQLKRTVSHNSNFEYDDNPYSKSKPKNYVFSEEQMRQIEAYIEKRVRERVEMKLEPATQEIINKAIEELNRKSDDKYNMDQMMRTSVKKKPMMMMNSMSSSNNQNMRASMKKSVIESKSYSCNGCGKKIEGLRFSCTVCQDFDYCDKCESTKDHQHPFIKHKPDQQQQPAISQAGMNSEPASDFLSKIKRVDPPQQGIHFNTPKGPSIKKYAAKIVREPIYDVMRVKQGKNYNLIFTIKNSGETKWPDGVRLVCIGGIHDKKEEPIGSLEINAERTVNLNLTAPEDVGKYASHWRLQYPEDSGFQSFGANLFFEVHVIEDKDKEKEIIDELPELNDLDYKMIKGKILKFE